MRKKLPLFFLSFLINAALYAQFSGLYAPDNWTTTKSPGSNGTVNSTDAPNSILIAGSDNNSGGVDVDIDFTISAHATGIWSFSWSYETSDGPTVDPAYVLRNGVLTLLSTGPELNQNGTFNEMVNLGDIIGFKVRATDDLFGNALLTISSFIAPGGVIPIKLISFTAIPDNNEVKINWTTSLETENNRFEIERSTDGNHFFKIGTIKSLGNSTQKQNYSFVDPTPGLTDNYYRLRHFDNDHKFYVSNIVICSFDAENEVIVYPNPSGNIVYLSLGNAGSSATETIRLLSANFNVIETKSIKMQTAGGNKIRWDISRLPPGNYYFKMARNGKMIRLIKK